MNALTTPTTVCRNAAIRLEDLPALVSLDTEMCTVMDQSVKVFIVLSRKISSNPFLNCIFSSLFVNTIKKLSVHSEKD